MTEIFSCAKCRKSFEAIAIGGGMSSPELEDLVCPFCGWTARVLSAGRLVTRPLPDQDGKAAREPPKKPASN